MLTRFAAYVYLLVWVLQGANSSNGKISLLFSGESLLSVDLIV